MIEILEARIAPALLAPVVTNGVLLIQHDAASGSTEDVNVKQTGPDTFSITDSLGQMFPDAIGVKSITFIETSSTDTLSFSKDGLAGTLNVMLSGGTNTVTLESVDGFSGKIQGPVTIEGGDGDDYIGLSGGIVIAGTTKFTGGKGIDGFSPDGAYLAKKVTLGSVEGITVDNGSAPVVIGSLLVENDDELAGPVTFILSNVATVLGPLKYCGGVAETDNVTLDGQFLGPVNLMLLGGENNVTTAGSFNKTLLMTGGGGNDTITFHTKQIDFDPMAPRYVTAQVSGAVAMKLGDGTNIVTLDGGSYFNSNVAVTGGAGADTFNFTNAYLSKNLTLSAGSGANTLTAPTKTSIANVVRGAFKYTGGANVDQLDLNQLVAGTIKVALGDGANKVQGALQILGASASFSSGADADNFNVSVAGIKTKLSVKLGGGTDTFTFGGGNLTSAVIDGGLGDDTLAGMALLPTKLTLKGFEHTT